MLVNLVKYLVKRVGKSHPRDPQNHQKVIFPHPTCSALQTARSTNRGLLLEDEI